MPVTHTFETKPRKGAKAIEFSLQMPASIEDTDLIVKRYGSVERLIADANRQWTVNCQNGGLRERMKKGAKPDALNQFVETYVSGTKVPVVIVQQVTVDAEALGLTREMALGIQESGAKVINIPEE